MLTRRRFVAGSVGAVAVSLVGSAAGAASLPPVEVWRSPGCGCCLGWVRHMQAAGFRVSIRSVDDLSPFKRRAGLTEALQSCHTAFVGGYAIEGHVPPAEVKRLLQERPAGARGLAVPGMPVGSPGMEAGGQREAYSVILYGAGWQRVYRRYG